jgi:hypothetical protein
MEVMEASDDRWGNLGGSRRSEQVVTEVVREVVSEIVEAR